MDSGALGQREKKISVREKLGQMEEVLLPDKIWDFPFEFQINNLLVQVCSKLLSETQV